MIRQEKDVLYGLRAIADFMGIEYRQAKHRAASGAIPTFNMGRTVCATKSGLTSSISAREAEAMKPKLPADG